MSSGSIADRRFAVVRDVIHEWDPYLLLAGGAPNDEFDSEIRSIVKQIPRIGSANDAAGAVSRVFMSAFSNDARFSTENCAAVGAKLYAALEENGLVERGPSA